PPSSSLPSPPPRRSLFPYTTLFRSQSMLASLKDSPHTEELFSEHLAQARDLYQSYSIRFSDEIATTIARVCRKRKLTLESGVSRSEEHTSELQSRFDLVCRLLLDKK